MKYHDSGYYFTSRAMWNEKGEMTSNNSYVKSKVGINNMSILDDKGRECVLQEGAIEVWKLCRVESQFVYCKLSVPEDAERVTPNDPEKKYKSRVSKAKVLEIVNDAGEHFKECESCVYDKGKLTYRLGEEVIPYGFNWDVNEPCGAGINVHRYQDHCKQWL